jgi:hypothetical protein
LRQERGHERAQVLVLFAITAASMLAVVGLLYSFGLVLSQRRSMQTVADSASLAGSWQVLAELANDNRRDSVVRDTVVQFAKTNGLPDDGTAADATYLAATYVDGSNAALTAVGAGGTFPTTARGVRVTVQKPVPSILPGFVQITQTLVQNSAAATARSTVGPTTATLAIPIAVRNTDVASALSSHATYDLFTHPLTGGYAPTLDLTSASAPSFGNLAVNVQYWSDGQHSGSWQMTQPATLNLAGATYYDAIGTGLRDNVRRQALTDASSAAYGVFTVPVYDTSTSTTVHIVGFAQMKLRGSTITSTSAPGLFVPYAVGAFGTPSTPSVDLGSAYVGLVQ